LDSPLSLFPFLRHPFTNLQQITRSHTNFSIPHWLLLSKAQISYSVGAYSDSYSPTMEDVDDEDDERLRQAIALSLQEAKNESNKNPPQRSDVLEISSDEDEPSDTQARLSSSNGRVMTQDKVAAADKVNHEVKQDIKPSGLLGLDRKAMEEQRLARKRDAADSISPPPVHRRKGAKIAHGQLTPGLTLETSDTTTAKSSDPTSQQSIGAEGITTAPGLEYPRGVVKKTWCFGFPRQGDDIKIEEILQKSALQLAVLSSFQWDVDWVMSKIDVLRTKLIFVMQAKDEDTRQNYRRETEAYTNFRLCFPPMPGSVNCMHSKLMLLSYKNHLRVVVPTANLVRYDWGETGVMENSVFLIDIPRRAAGQNHEENEIAAFGQELIHFCRAMGLQDDVVRSLHQFDYSNTKGIAFVHTIGGEHSGSDNPWRRTGFCGLGRSIQTLGLSTSNDLMIDFIASSIGAINQDFLSTLYLAAQGDDGTSEYEWRTNATNIIKHKGKAPPPSKEGRDKVLNAVKNNMRLYFPSYDTVEQSKGGRGAGGPICFQEKYYHSPKFPKQVLRDCKSVREGLLMHNKVRCSCVL